MTPSSNDERSEDIRKNFYHIAIHFIYAIVIAHSFAIASGLLIPLNDVFTSEKIIQTLALFLAYIIIISSWIGYTRSISVKPHKDTSTGAMRFFIDLVILFEYFYLLQLSQTEYFDTQIHLIILVIFGTYMVWDAVKYFEHTGKGARNTTKSRGRKTLFCFILCMMITFLYEIGAGFKDPQSNLIWFIGTYGSLIIMYRMSKWNVINKKTAIPK